MFIKHLTACGLLFVMMTVLSCATVIAEEKKVEKSLKKADTVQEEDDIWKEVSFESEGDQELTEEQIQETLNSIKESDPNKAAELENLKNTDTGKFIAAIRTEIQKQLRSPKKPKQEEWKEHIHKKHEVFLNWLKKHYPEDHKELIRLRNRDAEKFVQRVMDLMTIYEPIQKAQRINPKLADAMKKNLELQKRRDDLLLEIRFAPEDQQKELTAELQTVVAQRFDAIVLEKQLQHRWLRQRLNALTEKLENHALELESLKKNKDQSVQDRIDELMGRTERVNWD